MSMIPREFLPRSHQDVSEHHEGEEQAIMPNLFGDEDDAEEEIPLEEVSIGGQVYKLAPPPDVGTLFAHRVWSGSKLLAEYLSARPDLIKGKRTIEFGAGTALPSLVALSNASFCCITDFPDKDVLVALRETVGQNWETIGCPNGRVAVVGHEWGTNIDNIRHAVAQTTKSQDCTSENENDLENAQDKERLIYFDVAILSECLWMHSSHAALAKSVNALLHPQNGIAIITYAHHIPGLEEKDDAFFDLCSEKYGFRTKHVMTKSLEYMWDSDRKIDVQLKLMQRG